MVTRLMYVVRIVDTIYEFERGKNSTRGFPFLRLIHLSQFSKYNYLVLSYTVSFIVSHMYNDLLPPGADPNSLPGDCVSLLIFHTI